MRITVKVHPRAKRDRLTLSGGPDQYKLEVTAPPVDGAANEAVIAFFAKKLKVPRARVQIVTGERARRKVVDIPTLEGLLDV
jgi:uncharacterized protein (TIGR00251 family)